MKNAVNLLKMVMLAPMVARVVSMMMAMEEVLLA